MNSLNKTLTKRPKNLNLLTVKFPMSAIMSVGHRAAGVFLFLLIPYVLYLLQLSLHNEADFLSVKAQLQNPLFKLFSFIVLWSLVHHLLAGIRYFLLDFDVGIEKQIAQKSALMVMVAGFVISLIFALLFFL